MVNILLSLKLFSIFNLFLIIQTQAIFDVFGLTNLYANCPGAAISYIDYVMRDGRMTLDFRCTSSEAIIAQETYSGRSASSDNMVDLLWSYKGLESTDFECRTDFVLQRFQLRRDGLKVYYDYTCVGSKVDNCSSVSSVSDRCFMVDFTCFSNVNLGIPDNVVLTGMIVRPGASSFIFLKRINFTIKFCWLRNIAADMANYLTAVNSNRDYAPRRIKQSLHLLEDDNNLNETVFHSNYISKNENAHY